MTHLRSIMLEEMQLRNYSDPTARYYLRASEEFARHFGKSPDKLDWSVCAPIRPICSSSGSWPSQPASIKIATDSCTTEP